MVDVGAHGDEIGKGWIGILGMVMMLESFERWVIMLRCSGGEVVGVLRFWMSRGETEGNVAQYFLRLQII